MIQNRIAILSRNDQVLFDCSWRVLNNISASTPSQCGLWQTVDVLFLSRLPLKDAQHDINSVIQDFPESRITYTTKDRNTIQSASGDFASRAAYECLLRCLQAASSSHLGCVAKFIVPLTRGHVVRSDIVSLRFIDCEVVASAMSIADPLQFYPGTALSQEDQTQTLDKILCASVAGLLLQDTQDASVGRIDTSFEDLSAAAELELSNRMSFSWISREPLHRLRLVLVEGSASRPDLGGTALNIYPTAKALGIDLVVLDNAGHWLESAEFEHWREAFIPTKLVHTVDPEFADRIIASVKSYDKPVDGIITFFDKYTVDVARAAVALGLPTVGSPESYRIATNKYETSVVAGHNGFKAFNAESAVRAANERNIEFPLIIKPCNGWSSEGVFRVNDLEELEKAVHSIDQARHGADFVVEKYCSGPEVDANFVLLDGKVLFFESSDDTPKSADANAVDCSNTGSLPPSSANFIELSSVFPSALPKDELDMLRNDFQAILARVGFENGIMHLEGRMEHSSLEYRTDERGITDLGPKVGFAKEGQSPTPWLIEINPRPPGMKGTQIIESTYGVDYWGLDMLLALGRNKDRIRALSQPFANGPQYTSVMVFIPADFSSELQGIFDSEDICNELFMRRPDLIKSVSRFGCLVQKGQKVPHPNSGVNSFLAYFNVFSRRSREEALKLAALVRQEVRFSFR